MSSTSAATSFVGRDAEREDLRALVDRTRVLTLIGAGGAGKTRLAESLLDDLSAGYGDRCWSVGLAECQDPALVITTVASGLGMITRTIECDGSGLAEFVGAEPALLVLDNCEHLLVDVADLVALLVARCPGLIVVATSRAPLGVAAETTYPVAPMRLPELAGSEDPDPADVARWDAVRLFLERAQATLPGFELTSHNARTVVGIVAAVGGIPLAIELAAARLRTLDLEVLRSRLAAPLDVLGSGPRDAALRHQSLEASVDWSYQLCSPRERAVWRRLSVFAGGFDLEAAEAVCAQASDGPGEVLDVIGSLVDQSVLHRDPDRPARYQMLEVIRHFGQRHLDAGGETGDAHLRHLNWCRLLSEEFAGTWFGPDQVRWLDRLRDEHPNLRVALDHAIATDPESALRICAALDPYWTAAGHFAEARLWISRVLRLRRGPAHLRARLTALAICGSALRGQLAGVAEAVAGAEGLLAEDPDPGAAGMLDFASGMVASAEQRYAEASTFMERSAQAFTTAGEGYGRARSRYQWAFMLFLSGEVAPAVRLAEQVLEEADTVGDLQTGAYALWVLGMDAVVDPGPARAEELLVQALDRAGTLGELLGTAFFLEFLAWVVALGGEPRRSAGLVGAADAVWRSMGLSATSMPQIANLIGSGTFRHRVTAASAYPAEYTSSVGLLPAEAVALGLGVVEPEAAAANGTGPVSPLTRRELEIADLVAEGLSNRGIATSLHLSERTVQGHVQSILRKLDFRSRVQIASWVIRAGG